ncbi:MAG: V4R domain-containing protein [Candidatus Jordarchaeum sp.]|uniref:V4R domain-containing protein n=1 Tax=Candidatus Jordarchaeum sp. TaxID=2823881 RepID=UPI00404A4C83
MDIKQEIKEFLRSLKITENGSLLYRGERVVFTPSVLMSIAFTAAPYEKFGDTMRAVYRSSIVKYGREIAKENEHLGIRGVFEYLLKFFSTLGWGRSEITEFSGLKIIFRVYSSLYGKEVGSYLKLKGLEPQPSCPFGYAAEGVLNYFAEKEGKPLYVSQEVKCAAKGDEFCEFIIIC